VRPRNVSVWAPQVLNPMTQTERGGADFRNIDFDAKRHVAEIDLVSSSVLSSNNGVGRCRLPLTVRRRHQERSMASHIAATIR
jgi:hypothetical protein